MKYILLLALIFLVILPIFFIIITRFLEKKNIDPEKPLFACATCLNFILLLLFDKSELHLYEKIIYSFIAGFISVVLENTVVIPLWEDLISKLKNDE